MPPPDKPPYQVPLMADIAAVPWNGFTVASTFSGAGGSCTGYRMAGFRVAWASEFVAAAADTYAANHPETILDRQDIRDVEPAAILETLGIGVGELDLLDGSPPCASFSMSGRREATWGRIKQYSEERAQRTDDLFLEFARLVDGIRPRVFIAENVEGLVRGTAKGYFKVILRSLRALGYRVEARLLDASWLGVPQARRRIFFIGVREDLGLGPVFPKPLPYRYTVRDALPWITAAGRNKFKWGQEQNPTDAGSPAATILVSPGPQSIVSDDDGGRIFHRAGRDNGQVTIHRADEPAPTVQAAGLGGVGLGQFGMVVSDQGTGFGPAGVPVTDRVMRTIKTRAEDVQVWEARSLVHDTGGYESTGDVTDRPAPTITPGVDGVNAYHWQVGEDPVGVLADTWGKNFGTPQAGDVTDRLAPAVTTHNDQHLAWVSPATSEHGLIPPGSPDPDVTDQPMPTILAGDSIAHYQVWAGAARDGQGRPVDPETGAVLTIGEHTAVYQAWARHFRAKARGRPVSCRKLTLGELRRLAAFPDDYVLTGSYAQRWERIGRAVPPVMMAAIAAVVRDGILIPARDA